jgi:hypothetical protein
VPVDFGVKALEVLAGTAARDRPPAAVNFAVTVLEVLAGIGARGRPPAAADFGVEVLELLAGIGRGADLRRPRTSRSECSSSSQASGRGADLRRPRTSRSECSSSSRPQGAGPTSRGPGRRDRSARAPRGCPRSGTSGGRSLGDSAVRIRPGPSGQAPPRTPPRPPSSAGCAERYRAHPQRARQRPSRPWFYRIASSSSRSRFRSGPCAVGQMRRVRARLHLTLSKHCVKPMKRR